MIAILLVLTHFAIFMLGYALGYNRADSTPISTEPHEWDKLGRSPDHFREVNMGRARMTKGYKDEE